MKKSLVLLIGFMILVFSGCVTQQPLDIEAEKAKVEIVLDQHIQLLKTEDMELLTAIYAHDPDMINIGTDATERIVGWEELKDLMQQQFDMTETNSVGVRERVIHIHTSGSVAWFSEILDWELTFNEETIEMEGLRATGVLDNRGGNWLLVQVHYSVPTNSEEG